MGTSLLYTSSGCQPLRTLATSKMSVCICCLPALQLLTSLVPKRAQAAAQKMTM